MRVLDFVGRFTVGLKIMKLQMGFQIQVLFSLDLNILRFGSIHLKKC